MLDSAAAPAAFALRGRLEAMKVQSGLELVALAPRQMAPSWTEQFEQVKTAKSSGRWFEQRLLPGLTRQADVNLVWSLGRAAPLRSPVPWVIELAPAAPAGPTTILDRVLLAMGEAGAAGAALRYSWQDLQFEDDRLQPDTVLAPFVHSSFRATSGSEDKAIKQQLDLPAAYVLAHLDSNQSLKWLLAVWSWVDASVGDQIPLVVAGLDPVHIAEARLELERLDLDKSVRILSELNWEQLPGLYRGCQAFLHSGFSRTGQELRWALATGAPIAGFDRPPAGAITGGAAYLTPPGDARALGAACLTLLVEAKEVAEDLRQKGLMRAGAYHGQGLVSDWWNMLTAVAGGSDVK
jgi:hypothetical protein